MRSVQVFFTAVLCVGLARLVVGHPTWDLLDYIYTTAMCVVLATIWRPTGTGGVM